MNNTPEKIETPYGGQLVFKLPNGSWLTIHLKDKTKIRHKKRWSQVMYMYYLLGYKYFNDFESIQKLYNNDDTNRVIESDDKTNNYFKGFGKFLHNIDSTLRTKLENTYILTLDGDVEFKPEAVKQMCDKMKTDLKIGSVCGRVWPIGSGPIVWYQKFEYAIGHWLQKVAEHVFGSVMCSPGCFSLLRGSCLMEDQILPIYLSRSSESTHFVQYDQGEDRWLSTLIIQQGYYIVYCSSAHSQTYSPETFHEYFNQRRRWIPSTMANLIDFLKDYKHILNVNKRITFVYVCYILVNFIASLLGPSAVTLMIAETLQIAFGFNLWLAYLLSIAPAIFFILCCYYLQNNNHTQIRIAAILSSLYSLAMTGVLIGSIARVLSTFIFNPSGLLLFILIGVFLIAGLMHPSELKCLIPGLLYFLCLPAAFVFLNIYAMFNLNNMSWGTREINTKIVNHKCDKQIVKKNWTDHELLVKYEKKQMNKSEMKFFENLIDKYLHPLIDEQKEKEKIIQDLNELRNRCCFLVFMLNALWITTMVSVNILQKEYKEKLMIKIPTSSMGGSETIQNEPIGFLFVILFVVVILAQFMAMFWHRCLTFIQLIRNAKP